MKPILFNTEMVKAILDGRKTATRRPVKHSFKRDECREYFAEKWREDYERTVRNNILDWWVSEKAKPKYFPDDILYVRETWMPCATIDSMIDDINLYAYRADYNSEILKWMEKRKIKWHPSIHMPKEVARIFLRVTDVWVERLQDITPEEMDKEGLPFELSIAPYEGFETMWNGIYADQGYSWESNPYVWVYEFERVEV